MFKIHSRLDYKQVSRAGNPKPPPPGDLQLSDAENTESLLPLLFNSPWPFAPLLSLSTAAALSSGDRHTGLLRTLHETIYMSSWFFVTPKGPCIKWACHNLWWGEHVRKAKQICFGTVHTLKQFQRALHVIAVDLNDFVWFPPSCWTVETSYYEKSKYLWLRRSINNVHNIIQYNNNSVIEAKLI